MFKWQSTLCFTSLKVTLKFSLLISLENNQLSLKQDTTWERQPDEEKHNFKLNPI